MAPEFTERRIDYAGSDLQVWVGGEGPPLLVLHGAGGNPQLMPYHYGLAENHTCYVPSHPGFETSTRPEWIDSITAVSHFYLGLLDKMELPKPAVMGFSMGGWIAAEMAAMCSGSRMSKLVIVSGVGVRPQNGSFAELFNNSREEVAGLRFYDVGQVPDFETHYGRKLTPEQAATERDNRETAAKWCWQPYMYNPNLQRYLAKVQTPTLIVWGKQDKIAPVECAELYRQAIPNSQVALIDRCGHIPSVERPEEFFAAVNAFLIDG